MMINFDFTPYEEFYGLLTNYIPSLIKLDKKTRYIILNIDLIRTEAEKSDFKIKYTSVSMRLKSKKANGKPILRYTYDKDSNVTELKDITRAWIRVVVEEMITFAEICDIIPMKKGC